MNESNTESSYDESPQSLNQPSLRGAQPTRRPVDRVLACSPMLGELLKKRGAKDRLMCMLALTAEVEVARQVTEVRKEEAREKREAGAEELFERAVRTAVDKEHGELTIEDKKKVQRLDLSYQPSHRVLPMVKELPSLRILYLQGAEVTDVGLEYLKDMKGLTVLFLAVNPITNAGLKHLRGLEALVELNLNFTGVTDAGVEN